MPFEQALLLYAGISCFFLLAASVGFRIHEQVIARIKKEHSDQVTELNGRIGELEDSVASERRERDQLNADFTRTSHADSRRIQNLQELQRIDRHRLAIYEREAERRGSEERRAAETRDREERRARNASMGSVHIEPEPSMAEQLRTEAKKPVTKKRRKTVRKPMGPKSRFAMLDDG